MGTVKVTNIEPIADNGTVTLGGSGDTIVTGSGVTNKLGITQTDNWRLISHQNTGSNADVTAGWSKNDNTGFGYIGDGLTESSGVFTFPATGIYLIDFTGHFSIAANDSATDFFLQVTTDNSTYVDAALARGGAGDTASGESASASFFFDVTDTTQCKFKFRTGSFSTGTFLVGNTGHNRTSFHIIRLGDT